MDKPDREAKPQFSQPWRQIFFMFCVLALVGVGTFFVWPTIQPVVLANPYLNLFIFGVFLIGVLATFLQIFRIIFCVRWIEGFAAQQPQQLTLSS